MILNPHDGPGIYSVSPDSDYEDHSSAIRGLWGDRARQFDNGDDSTPTTSGGQGWPTWDAPVPTMRPLWWSLWQTYGAASGSQGYGWQVSGIGSGSNQVANFNATRGVYSTFNAGTLTTGYRGCAFGATGASAVDFWTNSHQWRYETAFSIPTLSNGTDTFTAFVGFNGAVSALTGDHAVVMVVNGATNFQCETANTGVVTTVDSGVPCVAGIVYRIVVVVTNISAVDFYICQVDQPLPASPTVTITGTTVPSHGITAVATIVKSAGTNNRTLNCYYQMLSVNRLAA